MGDGDDRAVAGRGTAAKRAILAGDQEGLRAFFDAHFRPLYGFCYHRLGRDHHSAEEAVQETMIRALERIADFDPERGDMHDWLATLARNEIRRVRGRRATFAGIAGDPAAPPGDGDGGEEGAATEPNDVGVALDRLPERYRSVLEQRYVQGLSLNEIAEVQEDAPSAKAVESLLGRARAAFRKAFLGVTTEVER